MKLELTARGIEISSDLREFIAKRVHFSFGRFAGRIRRLSIRLADLNGPRGGIDQCCDVRVNAGLPRKIVVRERQATIHAAIAIAMGRAERVVQRQIGLESATRGRPSPSRRSFGFGD